MLKLFLFVILLTVLSSCKNQSPVVSNNVVLNPSGYKFSMEVRTYNTVQETEKAINKYIKDWNLSHTHKISQPKDKRAMAVWAPDMSKCLVFLTKPSTFEKSEVMVDWGHELMHCVYGSFHR